MLIYKLKGCDGMEWITKMNMAITYIEDNLEDEINISSVAKVACVSTYHFYRLFDILSGISVGEYIRRRRLTKAGQELGISDTKVVDIALKYGYKSPEAFTKAFKKLHGINPSQAKKQEGELKLYPPLSFTLSVRGNTLMEYRIEKKEKLYFFGKALRNVNQSDKASIPKYVDDCYNDGTMDKMFKVAGIFDDYAIYMENNMTYETYTYAVAVEKKEGVVVPDDLEEFIIPELTWAIFIAYGPISQSLRELRLRIFGEWFPSSNYRHANAPMIEMFPCQMASSQSKDFKVEIWIPVEKNN